jgi:hypothetical protein
MPLPGSDRIVLTNDAATGRVKRDRNAHGVGGRWAKRGGATDAGLFGGGGRLEHEDLDCEVGVEVVVAHKPITLRPVSCSISRLTSACMTRC